MQETETYTRPIITFLKNLKGDDLFITGDCLLSPSTFKMFFIANHLSLRPVFILSPKNSKEKLILVSEGDIQHFGNKKYMSQYGLSVHFHNTLPCMYILRMNEWNNEIVWRLGTELREWESCELERKVTEKGLIQSTVIHVDFTATFQHENAKAGTFTLGIR